MAFINPREGRKISELEKKNQITFKQVEVPTMDQLTTSRMHNWANLIVNTRIDDQADAILQDIEGRFAHLSKEDLLKRLITSQLDHILTKGGGAADLNERREEKREKHQSDGLHRYFVNIGRIDGVTPGDLVHFLSDVSNVERRYFSNVTLQKNYAFFYLDQKQDNGFANYFKGMEIEGHMIRVNRDDQKSGKSAKKGKKNKGRRRGERGSRRRR